MNIKRNECPLKHMLIYNTVKKYIVTTEFNMNNDVNN